MPDTPERKPSLRGRPLLRGRGRGGSSSATTSAPGTPASGRLASLRRDTPSGAGSSPTPVGAKPKFAPKIPARRVKREPITPKPEPAPAVPVKTEAKAEPRRKKRFELIERVTGPFAQGPASLGSASGRSTAASVGGGFSSVTGAGLDDAGRPDLDAGAGAVVEETDHNRRAHESGFEVQTEAMALEAFERMSGLRLDEGVAAEFGFRAGVERAGEALEWAEDRLLVLQIPRLPAFEMDARARAQVLDARQLRGAEPAAMDVDVDVKPDLAKLGAAVADSSGEAPDEGVDGRIGTLVVLKSGVVKMKIGDILFDVARGAECNFMRGLMTVDVRGSDSVAHLLGNVDTQLLCTPDLDSVV